MGKRMLWVTYKPIKKFLVIVFLFMLTVSSCFAQDSKWIGIWNSNTINYDYKPNAKANQKVDLKINCEFFLFSDHRSFSKITFYFDLNAEGIKCTAETVMNCPGEWNDDGNLSVIPDDKKAKTIVSSMNTILPDVFKGYRLSASEKQILEAQLNEELRPALRTMINMGDFLGENGEFPIDRFKKMGMKLTKTEVEKPFYYIEPDGNSMSFMGMAEDVDPDLVRCCFNDSESGQFTIGLFYRFFLKPCYYCIYAVDGGFITSFDDGSLSSKITNCERKRCDAYVDSILCPESGQARFKFTDGCVYVGEWLGRQPSGEGCKTLPDGSWMKGIWKEGTMVEGTGMLKQPKGIYEGDLKNGQIFGDGVLTLSDGSAYDGSWQDGEFKTGTIKKKIDGLLGNEYVFEGSFEDSSFCVGKCVYRDGCIFEGRWNKMKIQDGSVTIDINETQYPVFEGVVENGILDNGCFTSQMGYKVSSDFNEQTAINNLTITFQNGDQCKGIWDATTGRLVPASAFEYIWSDGVKCCYTVDGKLKLKKPSYYNADGTLGKPKIARKRLKMNTDGEGYTIFPLTQYVKFVKSKINRKTSLPGEMSKEYGVNIESLQTQTKKQNEDNITNNAEKKRKKYINQDFILANYSISPTYQHSFGFTLGGVKKFGWYISAMTNGSFDFQSDHTAILDDNGVNNGYLWSGEETTSRFSATAGGLLTIGKYGYFYAGLGYGVSNRLWYTMSDQAVSITPGTYKGLALEAGLMFNLGEHVLVSAGALMQSSGANYEMKFGIGYKF